MGWKSKPRNDWGHVNQLIQHFNDYGNRFRKKRLSEQVHTWGRVSTKLTTQLNDKADKDQEFKSE